MKKSKRIISLLLAMLLLFSCVVGTLTSCKDNNGGEGEGNEGGEDDGGSTENKTTYTVRVKNLGGRALKDVNVYLYSDVELSDIVAFGKTDSNGIAKIEAKTQSVYYATLDYVPDGYNVKDYYTVDSASEDIVLTSSVILPETEGKYTVPSSYGLGDIMYDFEVKTVDTVNPENVKTVRLSELLKTKKAVLINFWYSTCSPCISEFPYIDTVAKEYADDVAVICLNTYEPDNESAVAAFKATYELSLDMAKADHALFGAFGTAGYPTNVMVDRYGTICLIEVGGLPSEKPFRKMFEYFGADEYEQKIFQSLDELVPKEVPDVEQPDSSVIEEAVNADSMYDGDSSKVTYYPEQGTADAEYSWPFIVGKKGDFDCIYPSNSFKDSSYAIMHADVVMKKGDVLGFDYFASTEENIDVLYILVDGEDIYQISGESTEWNSCYPYVAERDGTYTVSLVYTKDSGIDTGDDTIYLKNWRIVTKNDIDTPTYIPYLSAIRDDDTGEFSYANVKYCSQDGYYHYCNNDSADHNCAGVCPLILADLMGTTQLSSEESVYLWAYNGEIVVGGKNYYDDIVEYCSYASNGTIVGLCTVNQELKELLDVVVSVKGFDKSENEWLKMCKYYVTYCTDGPLADPIAGLAPHSAFDTFLTVDNMSDSALADELKVLKSENEYPNKVVYDGRIIMPRGLWYAFTPAESGVYRITSNSASSVNGWLFTGEKRELLVYDHIERFTKIPENSQDERHQMNNVSMVFYMEAGTTYYIDIAYYDVTQAGEFTFKVEYEAPSLKLFRSASPGGAFTYDLNEDGSVGSTIIAGGIDVALDPDSGYFRHVLATDKNGNVTKFGEYVYLDLTLVAGPFDKPIYFDDAFVKEGALKKDLVSLGGFDFGKTESDRNGILYLTLYALLGLRDYAVNGESGTFKTALANNISAWELEAMKKYLDRAVAVSEETYRYEIVNFLTANKSAASDVKALEALLDAYSKDKGSNEAFEALDNYVTDLIAGGNEAKLKAFYSVGKDSSAKAYVKDYTDEKLKAEYFADLSVLSDSVKAYLEDYVDDGLADMWGDDYEFWHDAYRVDDLKKGITHGNGKDYTDDIMKYVAKMFNDATDKSTLPEEVAAELNPEAYGCVLVDAELAAILQTLMDTNTFRGVKNSWTKICYYYEYYGPSEK